MGGWTVRGCISQLCGFQSDESRQHQAFLRLTASIYPTALVWRRATTAPAMLEGPFLSGWTHKTALKVSRGLQEQQCKCVAQRPTWQTRTSSRCDVISPRLKQDYCTVAVWDCKRLVWSVDIESVSHNFVQIHIDRKRLKQLSVL